MKKLLTLIGLLLSVAFFLLIPTTTIKADVRSQNEIAYDKSFPSIAHGFTVSQQFIPQYSHIENLNICIRELKCDTSQGYLLANILDSTQNTVYQNKLSLSEITGTGWQTVLSDIKLKENETYYLTLDAVDVIDDGPTISYYTENNAANKEEVEQTMTYAGSIVTNGVLKTAFEYVVPLSKADYLAYYFFFILVIAIVISRRVNTR